MKNSKYRDRVFVDNQHRTRGIISGYKSNRFIKGKNNHISSRFRSAIREHLLDARVTLHPSQFRDFLEWNESQIKTQLPELVRTSIGYDDLSGVITSAPKASLGLELHWISERIKVVARKINAFRLKAEKIECFVFSGDIEAAINELQVIESEFGSSMWGIQLRIALEEQVGGLERQKSYSSEVRGVFRRGLLAFVAYNTSVRNEDKTSLGKYLEDVKGRIDNHRYYDSFVKTYLRYRLACEFPVSVDGFAEILRVEQSHSLIDLFETFVAIIQEMVRREDLDSYYDVVIKCLYTLGDVQDYRLAKILLMIDSRGSCSSLEERDTNLSDALFSGNVRAAALTSRHSIKVTSHVDPWSLIYAGFAFGHGSRERLSEYCRPQDISRLIGRILCRCEASFQHSPALAKLVVNLGGLPAAVGINDFLQQIKRSRPDDELRPWLIGLNSPYVGIEDLSPKERVFSKNWFVAYAKGTLTEMVWSSFHNAELELEGTGEANSNAYLFTAAGLVREGQYQNAISLITDNSVDQGSDPVRTMAILLMLHAYFASGDRQNVISLIADEGSRGNSHRQFLPIRSALESYQWNDYKVISALLTAPIALYLLWVENESGMAASYLRFAIRKVLDQPTIECPSELSEHAEHYPHHQLIFFLRKVSVPSLMDHVRALKNTKMLMDERQKICASLRFLDPANADVYEQEISNIVHQQAVDEGLWIVDQTRIHVDIEALKRWATKELSEAFNRYRDLLEVDIDSIQDIDEIFKEMMSESMIKQKSFVPETEADAVFISILSQLRDEFMSNSSFGLDFYISQRIRHQSFIGLIRGPAEFSGLITTRKSGTSGYHRNDEWLGKFVNSSKDSIETISDAFQKFAAKFDNILITAKDNRFQMRSQEQIDGLIYLNLSPPLIFFLRSITRMDASLSDFINAVTTVLWAAIEPSLVHVRRFIAEELKVAVAVAFDELRASVKEHAGHDDPVFLELDFAIGKCSSDVQRELDVASQWFTHAGDIGTMRRLFELKQILNIAIESALKCQRAFEPEIDIKVTNGEIEMAASTLVFVNDMMFVALDNVRAHSGLKKPKVNILAHVDSEKGSFKLDVRSEVKNQNRAETDKKLKGIRDLIEARNFERHTCREGGSGFLKLAAVVCQNPKGHIDFGLNESDEFQLTVVYSLIIEPIIPEDNE